MVHLTSLIIASLSLSNTLANPIRRQTAATTTTSTSPASSASFSPVPTSNVNPPLPAATDNGSSPYPTVTLSTGTRVIGRNPTRMYDEYLGVPFAAARTCHANGRAMVVMRRRQEGHGLTRHNSHCISPLFSAPTALSPVRWDDHGSAVPPGMCADGVLGASDIPGPARGVRDQRGLPVFECGGAFDSGKKWFWHASTGLSVSPSHATWKSARQAKADTRQTWGQLLRRSS